MADAIPVSRKPKKVVEPAPEPAALPVAPVVKDEDYHGKDHPVHGKWMGFGWHKSN